MTIEPIFMTTLWSLMTTNRNIDWLHQMGAMVTPQTHRVETSTGIFKDAVYPAAKNVLIEECEGPPYSILNPDNRYRSLILVEPIGSMVMTPNPNIPQDKGINFSQNFAIKVWVNWNLLGSQDGNEGFLARDIINLLHGKKYSNVNPPLLLGDLAYPFYLPINKMKVTFVSEMEHTPQAVFGAYEFSRVPTWFRNDYGFFGLVFNMKGVLITSCPEEAFGYEENSRC